MSVGLTIPYLVPLYLGMTFNAYNNRPGVDIFPQECVTNPVDTPAPDTRSHYTVIETLSDVKKELDVSGDLSLKIKTGMIEVSGKGSYLKNVRDLANKVEILVTLQHTASVKSFTQDCKPRDDWLKDHNVNVLGTHYVSRITYGAEMIASLRFECFNSSDVSEVKGAVKAAFQTSGNATQITAAGELEKLQKAVENKANLAISYYGTVPLKSIANDIQGFRTLTNTFKEQVEEAGLEGGIPMKVDLAPLEDIADDENRDKFKFNKNNSLQTRLSDFERKLDEMRKARLDLTSWAKALPYFLDDKYEKEIGVLLKDITKVTQVFYDVCWKLNVSQGPEQLKPALDAYNQGGKPQSNKYQRETTRLIQRLNPLIKRDDIAPDTYIQYGNTNCTAPDTQVLHDGFVISSTEEGIGGMAHYDCAPKSPAKGYDLENGKLQSNLAGIRYTNFTKETNPFEGPNAKDISQKGVTCAKCYTPNSASVAMFSATETCPLTWEIMYTGYLMSCRDEAHTTHYVCVDDTPAAGYKMDNAKYPKDTMALTTVHPDGSLPKNLYVKDAYIRCAVCAMKTNQVSF